MLQPKDNPDVERFGRVLSRFHADFQQNPFQYSTENPVVTGLYCRLNEVLSDSRVPISFDTAYGDGWRANRAEDLADTSPSECSRVVTEGSFVENEEPWRLNPNGNAARFDLVILANDPPLQMQSKRKGPGNYWDTQNSISVLCEVKHSKNMTLGGIYSGDTGLHKKDIRALTTFPGTVDRRVFLFADWWPETYDGENRKNAFFERLEEDIDELTHPVDVIYFPRTGDAEYRRIGE